MVRNGIHGGEQTGDVASCTLDCILSTPLECLALLGVCVWALAVRLCDQITNWRRPVDLLSSLFGYRDHRGLVGGHDGEGQDCALYYLVPTTPRPAC